MEDITYFLVVKLEGSTAAAKKVSNVRQSSYDSPFISFQILSMYPCAQPSDSIAYRASLTKYAEILKSSTFRAKEVSTTGPSDAREPIAALWWKEVAIRKSLFEECSGERCRDFPLNLVCGT